MKNVLDIFDERGFVEQSTDTEQLQKQLDSPTTCYIGFDPTARSLHAGSLLPIMSLMHMQRCGHRPIGLIGGGTGLVGDPSGKTEMRPIMTRADIDANGKALKNQLSRFIDFGEGKAVMLNNADWLTKLGYVEFLRDIGRHFSVNRMLAAESYRSRLESGLSFIEFNYMLLQSYDYWHLFQHHDCRLQMGGNDQWGNILAGADLVRRISGVTVHALTFPLLTTSSGIKMGKTHEGAIWLDPELTSPYDYYQYWINQADQDVERFLGLFTFLPMDEVKRLGRLEGAESRQAKEILAYEATKICHGRKEADRAQEASRQLFGSRDDVSPDSAPACPVREEDLAEGIPAYILFQKTGLCKTLGEARRLIAQGGGYLNGRRIQAYDQKIGMNDLVQDALLVRAGKKRYMKVVPDYSAGSL